MADTKKSRPRRMTERRCRAEVRQLVLESMPEVTKGLIEVAKAGNYNQAKLLAELSGLMDKNGEADKGGRRTNVVKLLMRELDHREAEVKAEKDESVRETV